MSDFAKDTNVPANDCISRQAAIDVLNEYFARIGKLKRRGLTKGEKAISLDTVGAIKTLPSAQPQHTCLNCGRTANNGGWYEDGRTRCPIEEHYALPKDGYCHLWEKRKDWEDDYVKRAKEKEGE